MPLTGPAGSIGEYVKNAIDLAAAQNIQVVYADDECDTKKAVSAYQELKIKDVKVFYVACSGSVLALAPLAKENGDLIITAYAGSSEIRNTGDEVIRFIPDALSVVAVMKEYFSENPTEKYAIIHENQNYSTSLADGIAEALGPRLILQEAYASEATDVRTQLTKIKSSGADKIIVVPVSDKTAEIVYKQMKALGMTTPILGEVNVCEYKPAPWDFGFKTTCWKADLGEEKTTDFSKKFKDAYGKDSQSPFYDAVTYDSIQILDRLMKKTEDISELKKEILAGVQGEYLTYSFESNGEVIGTQYLRKIER